MHSVTLSRQFGASGQFFPLRVSACLLTVHSMQHWRKLTVAALGRHSLVFQVTCLASYFFTRPVH